MTTKKTNGFLLCTVLVGLLFDLILSPTGNVLLQSPWDPGSVAKYLVIFVLGVIYLKKAGIPFTEALPYNKPMKLSVALWMVVAVILINPISESLCQLGGIIFGDTFIQAFNMLDNGDKTLVQNIFCMAVIPAVFEEMIYRGFLYGGYKKGQGTRIAIILTGILFGMFHMISQQAVYAAVIGVIIAIIRELTGSMWPGMLLHFINNGQGFLYEKIEESWPAVYKYLPMSNYGFQDTFHTVFTLAATVAAVPLLYLVLKKVASIEGRADDFRTFFKEEPKLDENGEPAAKEKLFTATLIITLVLEIGMMVFMNFFINWISELGIMVKK